MNVLGFTQQWRHPNISSSGDGSSTLLGRLRQGPIPQEEVLRLVLQVCEAVDYVHRLGWSCLDVDPDKVLVDRRGEAQVLVVDAQRVDVAAGAVVTRDISRLGALLDQCLRPAEGTALAAVCRACLEPDPRKHYASVDALIRDLRRINAGLAPSVHRPGLVERTGDWLRREPRLALAVGVVFVGLLAVGLVATGLRHEAERSRHAVAGDTATVP